MVIEPSPEFPPVISAVMASNLNVNASASRSSRKGVAHRTGRLRKDMSTSSAVVVGGYDGNCGTFSTWGFRGSSYVVVCVL